LEYKDSSVSNKLEGNWNWHQLAGNGTGFPSFGIPRDTISAIGLRELKCYHLGISGHVGMLAPKIPPDVPA
jgi:hypothetical protein